jgi:hypothetical protein
MGRIVTIAESLVARAAGLTWTPWAAAISIILLLHRIFGVVPAVGAPADAAVQRLGEVRPRLDRMGSNQTPLVYSMSRLTHADQANYGAPAAATVRSGWASIVGYRQGASARAAQHLPAQRRQRRRPSALAISAALHGGER